jgi:hypothetical protein
VLYLFVVIAQFPITSVLSADRLSQQAVVADHPVGHSNIFLIKRLHESANASQRDKPDRV